MKYVLSAPHVGQGYQRRRARRAKSPIGMLGISALACGGLVGVGLVFAPQIAPVNPVIHLPAWQPPKPHSPAHREVRAPAVTPTLDYRDLALLDPNVDLGGARVGFGEFSPLQAGFQPFVPQTMVAAAPDVPVVQPPRPVRVGGLEMAAAAEPAPLPVPVPRPPELSALPPRNMFRPAARLAAQRTIVASTKAVEPAEPASKGGFFEKMFGSSEQPKSQALAYAAPDDASLRQGPMSSPASAAIDDRLTAIYDISAHTVFMPDGTRLEAHSGLGDKFDDPRHVDKRMHGPTPPNVYNLTPREALFHGVRALRLTPSNPRGMFGRDGILAHTYMLGQRGDSNGCVSFRNYDTFLQAYLRGEVKRLVVVAKRG